MTVYAYLMLMSTLFKHVEQSAWFRENSQDKFHIRFAQPQIPSWSGGNAGSYFSRINRSVVGTLDGSSQSEIGDVCFLTEFFHTVIIFLISYPLHSHNMGGGCPISGFPFANCTPQEELNPAYFK